MFSRLVSQEISYPNPQKPIKTLRNNVQNTQTKRNVLLSFGVSNSNTNNIYSPDNLEDCLIENAENETDLPESPNNQIQSILQRHHFTSNQNNITFLNANHNSSNLINEDMQTLENELRYYQELQENISKNYENLHKKHENMINQYKPTPKPNEILSRFNPFLRKDQEKTSPLVQEKNSLLVKMRELESELQDWKQKCEIMEKEHIGEIAELKGFLKTSQFSADSTNNITAENQQDLVRMNERLDLLMIENEKINSLITEIMHEINTITKANFLLNERHEFYRKNLHKIEENYEKKEQNLLNDIRNAENEVKILKESLKFNKIEMYDSLMINNSLIVSPEKKIEFLESENRKLEGEIQSWRVQYWNLEKKQENEVSPELKYTEIDLKEIINKVNRQHISAQNELMNKMNVLEIEINKLNKRSHENPGNLRQFTSPERSYDLKNIGKIQKNINSEKKDKVAASANVAFKTLKFKNIGESERKTKVAIFSNSLGNENQTVSHLGGMVKKETKNNNFVSYTEKILRKMKK